MSALPSWELDDADAGDDPLPAPEALTVTSAYGWWTAADPD